MKLLTTHLLAILITSAGLGQNISNENPDARCKVLTNRDSLLSVLGTPTEFDSSKQTIAINDLFVRTPDTLHVKQYAAGY